MYKTQRLKSTLYQCFKRQLKTPTCFGSFVIHPQGVLNVLDWNYLWYFVCVVIVWQSDFLDCDMKRNVKLIDFKNARWKPEINVVSLLECNIFLNKLCWLTTLSSLSLVTHTTGMTHLKNMVLSISTRVTVPYAACIQLYPPEDEHLRLETCRGI